MPEIRQYTPQSTPSGPVPMQAATGEDFGEGVGKAVQNLGNTISGPVTDAAITIKKYNERQEISSLDAKMSKAQADLSVQYQDQLQKGTLNTQDFMQSVSDRMDNVQQGVSSEAGRQYFEKAQAGLNRDFLVSAAKGQAQLAGEQAINNFSTSLENRSSALMNNPTSFETARQQQSDMVDSLVATGGLPATHADALKRKGETELAESAVRGWMTIDPSGAKAQLDNGQWDKYMDGNTKYRMVQEVDRAQRAQDIETERRKKAAQDAADAKQEASKTQMLNNLYGNGLSTNDVLKNQNIDEGTKEHFLKMIEARQNEKAQNDNYTVRKLFDQIHQPQDPNNPFDADQAINEAYIKGDINHEGLQLLRGETMGKGTLAGQNETILKKGVFNSAFQAIAKPDPITKLPDPTGANNYQQWQMDAMKKIQTAKANGSFSLDMYNPKSDKFIGSNFNQYQRSPEEIIQDMVKGRQPQDPLVDVVSPEGKTGKLPQSKVDDYIKNKGFKKAGK